MSFFLAGCTKGYYFGDVGLALPPFSFKAPTLREQVTEAEDKSSLVHHIAENTEATPSSSRVSEKSFAVVGTTLGAAVDYRIVESEKDGRLFEIDQEAFISFRNILDRDFEKSKSYDLVLRVVSNRESKDYNIKITLENVDEPPEFSGESTYKVLENASVGQPAFTVLSQDPEEDTIRYELLQGGEYFRLEADGQVVWKVSPNFEQVKAYTVKVKASAGGKETSKSYEVQILNKNEALLFDAVTVGIYDNATMSFTLAENTKEVGTVTATDTDGKAVSYGKEGTDAALLNVDAATGEISFIMAPDFEMGADYDITIVATTEDETERLALMVVVTNVNEALLFDVVTVGMYDDAAMAFTLAENTKAVGTVTATDTDGKAVSYGKEGTDAALFNVDVATGEISFITAPDFEMRSDYDITIVATTEDETEQLALMVVVTNVNEVLLFDAVTAGMYDDAAMTFTLVENTKAVGTVAATDTDGKVVSYGKEGTDAALFSVDVATGEISFITAPDFEMRSNYDITIVATTEDETERLALMVAVTNVNEALLFDAVTVGMYDNATMSFTLAENTKAVGTVMATDIDGKVVSYGKEGTDAELLNLDAITGEISFITAPDFEMKSDYDITIVAATEDETKQLALMVAVTNVNEVPELTNALNSLTWQKGEIDLTYDVSVLFTDVDQGDSLIYTVMGTPPAWLELVGSNLAIKSGYAAGVSDLLMPGSPAAEDIVIELVATDISELSAATLFTLMLTEAANNSVPIFVAAPTTLMLLEQYIGGTLYKFRAEDADVFDTVTYSLGAESDNPGYFVLDADGTLRIQAVVNAGMEARPDFEMPDDLGLDGSYDLVIVAKSRNDETHHNVKVMLENKNEELSITGGGMFSIDRTNIGSIATFMLEDEDAGSVFTYDLRGSGKDIFTITTAASGEGVLSIDAGLFDSLLEKGDRKSWTFDVIATSTSGGETQQIAEEIEVNLRALNRSPEWNGPPRTIATVQFVEGERLERWYLPHDWFRDDDDTGSSGLTYDVSLSTTGSRWLTYNAREGRVETYGVFAGGMTGERDVPNISEGTFSDYTATLSVTDSSGAKLELDFLIDVRRGTSTTPEFDMASYNFSVDENTTTVGMVSATDADGDDVIYSVVHSETNELFELFYVDALGNIVARNPLDHEEEETYNFKVRAQGGGKDAVVDVSVMVNDLPDAPTFGSAPENFYVEETTVSVTFDASVIAAGGTPVYMLRGDDAAKFSVDATGRVSPNSIFDFENPLDEDEDNVYQVEVVSNFSGETAQSTKAISIHVLDDNDETPLLAMAIGAVMVTQGDTDFRFTVPDNTFTDGDVNDILTYSYSFTGAPWLEDIGGGVLYAPYIPESATSVTVTVTVTDIESHMATTDFEINVLTTPIDEESVGLSLFAAMPEEDWGL